MVRPPTSARRDSGFTLIEVLGAAIILAIALASVLSVELTSLWGNRLSRNLTNASQVASDFLESIHRQSPTAVAIGAGTPVTVENTTYTPNLQVAPLSATLYVYTVTVTWQDDASFLAATPTQHSVSMQMLRSTMVTF